MESRDGSITPNSMVVLERGAGGISTVVGPSTSSRPPSGRRSRNMTPVQRSGSQLEVLPPDDEKDINKPGSRASSKSSQRPSSRSGSADNSPRQTQSAGSSGRRSRQGQESLDRANSMDGLASPTPADARPGSAMHKQVSLTTVKRNYEMHGIPKNESWDYVPDDIAKITPPITNGTGHIHANKNKTLGATGGLSHEAEGVRGVGLDGGNGDGINVLSEKERTEQRLNYLMEQLSMKDKELKQHEERRNSGSAVKGKDSLGKNMDPSSTMTDSYYVSTGGQAEMNVAEEPSTSKGASARPPPFLEDSRDDKPDKTKMVKDEDNDEDDDEEDDEEDEEEGPTAPIELIGEFLDSVMEEDYETADKLCKMILMYEPDNAECLQFQPLIEEMLKKLWHQQLYGSSSEDESGEEEEDDDDDDDDDDEDDEDSDEDSDEEESSESDSSDESEDDGKTGSGSASVVYPNEPDTSKSDVLR